MNRALKLIFVFCLSISHSMLRADTVNEKWITILVHGAVGIGANLCGNTITHIKHDDIEGTRYERNINAMRSNPYLFTLQPINKIGLHPVKKDDVCVNAAYIFSELYTDIAKQCGSKEDSTFYTFGWSGLISEKERTCAAHEFYQELKGLIASHAHLEQKPKIRIICYSHGCTMVLKFADLRTIDYCNDTFCIDETIMVGLPVNASVKKAISCAPFKKIYHIYSMGDKIQQLDVFTSSHIFSERTFKKNIPDNLTQIEFRFTAPLTCKPGKVLPTNMRGIINQSPGHVELWSFGWTNSMYRKNLNMYPLCGAVFIPFLIHAAQELPQAHVQVDIRPTQEKAFVTSKLGCRRICVPFMTCTEYDALLEKAMSFHPCNTERREEFLKLEGSVNTKAYK